jgi:drug/metabolite transporter (DMT)-like permease
MSEIAFAVFYAYLLLGERLIWTQILGAILVIAGVLQLLGKNMKPIEGKFNCMKGRKNHEYR